MDKVQFPKLVKDVFHLPQFNRFIINHPTKRIKDGKHVFMVYRYHHKPSRLPIRGTASPCHYSVYFQGFFYHLSAIVPKNPVHQSGPCGLKDIKLSLKVEDVSSTDAQAYIKAKQEQPPKCFVASEVGMTRYSPQQLRTLAQYGIEEMQKYDLLNANCQIFAAALVLRSVMTSRDSSVFAGTKCQLVDWDLRGRDRYPTTVTITQHAEAREAHRSEPYSFATGYLLNKPWTASSRFHFFRKTSLYWWWNHIVNTGKLTAISALYAGGPRARGAYDPEGRHGRFIYHMILAREHVRGEGVIEKAAWKETIHQLKEGKWLSALKVQMEYWRGWLARQGAFRSNTR